MKSRLKALMHKVAIFGILACSFFIPSIQAQENNGIDENALFSDTSSMIDSSTVVGNAAIAETKDKKSVAVSGFITSAALGSINRDYLDDPAFSNSAFSSSITGDINLDVRLTQGFKAFGTAEVQYWPIIAYTGKDSIHFAVPELFVDANIKRLVYFRTGKQVLQWGRCYFWNPTDLINIEKKSFIQKISAREGTYGVKMHVPFGTAFNIYGWLGTSNATRIDSVAGAVKVEWLMSNTETSVSIWDKKHYKPVYGADVSSRILGIDISGELALHQSYPLKVLGRDSLGEYLFVDGLPQIITEQKKWIPRLCIDLGRSFDIMEVQDRLSVNAEFYFNQVGNTDKELGIGFLSSLNATAQELSAIRAYLAQSGLYEMNNFSRFYCSLFCSMNKFIISDMTLTINAIGNLNQRCAIISTGLNYQNLSDFSLGLSVNSFVGRDNTEYTIIGDAVQVQLTAGVVF